MKDLVAEIECPGCHRKVKIKVKEMIPGTSRHCPYCQATFQFKGDDGRRVQRALDDLGRSIKSMSRQLRF